MILTLRLFFLVVLASMLAVTSCVGIILLGNIAMASYGLATVWRLPLDAKPEDVLLRRK